MRRRDQYPKTRQTFGDRPSRRRHMADDDSWPSILVFSADKGERSRGLTVHLLDDIKTDGSSEDSGERQRAG